MHSECLKRFDKSVHAAILSAAVSDFTPVKPANQKIKRKDKRLTIQLKPTTDIARDLGKRRRKINCLQVLHSKPTTVLSML